MAQGQTAYSLTGGNGSILINSTAATTGSFMAVQAVGGAAAVINNSGTSSNITDLDVTLTIDSGQIIYGSFSQITLSSGAVLSYYR